MCWRDVLTGLFPSLKRSIRDADDNDVYNYEDVKVIELQRDQDDKLFYNDENNVKVFIPIEEFKARRGKILSNPMLPSNFFRPIG